MTPISTVGRLKTSNVGCVLIRPVLSYFSLTTDALLRIAFVLAAIIIIAGLVFWTWKDFADARREAETKVSTASIAMDELAQRSLLVIDVALDFVVANLEEKGLDALDFEPERERLRRVANRLPETGAIVVADKDGDVVAAVPPVRSPGNVNVSDRDWFKALKDGKAEPYLGHALKGRQVHHFFFPVARPLRGPNGTFIGAAQVGVEATYIAYLFRNLDLGIGAYLGLYSTRDGAVVARYPMTEALLDETVATLPYFSELAKSQADSWTGWAHSAGQDHLVSARRLNGWPLIVYASLPEAAVYSSALTRLMWSCAVATMIIVALLLLTALAVRQARREASLVGELEHRVKNMLAVVAAVIDRAREHSQSVDELVSSLRGRIQSMSDTQKLLSRNGWRSVSLANLIRAELEPYATGTNINFDGPSLNLMARATHPVAMVIHELTTNAAKYGALSLAKGIVSVRWTLIGKDRPGAMLTIEWCEFGGPKVAVPVRQGYGIGVIRNVLDYELGGRVDHVFAADGIHCTIKLPALSTVETRP
jgi:two-component sensor histidine kinase